MNNKFDGEEPDWNKRGEEKSYIQYGARTKKANFAPRNKMLWKWASMRCTQWKSKIRQKQAKQNDSYNTRKFAIFSAASNNFHQQNMTRIIIIVNDHFLYALFFSVARNSFGITKAVSVRDLYLIFFGPSGLGVVLWKRAPLKGDRRSEFEH